MQKATDAWGLSIGTGREKKTDGSKNISVSTGDRTQDLECVKLT